MDDICRADQGGLLDPSFDEKMNPLASAMRESTSRMQTALLAANMESPNEVASALRQVTMLRAHHQVMRIVRFLELMDDIEEKMYESIELDMRTMELTESDTWAKLMTIQTNLQKNIIESNKLLQPFLDMDAYPVFQEVGEAELEIDAEVLDISADKRAQIRDTAGLLLDKIEDEMNMGAAVR